MASPAQSVEQPGDQLAAGKPGSELLAPLAIVTLGGLLTSTILNLVVIPAGFSLVFGRTTHHTKGDTSHV